MLAASRSNGSARNRLLGLLVAGAVLLAASPAWAKKRVVVLGFSGPQSGKAEAAVAKVVKKKHTIISAKKYSQAQKKLRLKKPSNGNVAKIAAEIQADAIVSGQVKRKGARWSLVLKVREGATGKVIDTINIPLRAPRVDARAREDIASQLLPAIARADGPGGAVAKKPPKKKPPKKRPDPVEEEPAYDDEAVPGIDEEPEEEPEEVASNDDYDRDPDTSIRKRRRDDDDTPDVIVGGRHARHAAVDLGVGMSFIGRNMTFTFKDTLTDMEKPNGYAGSPVPGAYVSAEVYPLAFGGGRGILTGLGVGVVFDRVFVLKSRYKAEEYDTTQSRWGIGVRFRFPFGNKPTLPTLKLAAGYSKLDFNIDTGGMDIDLPNVAYSYYDVGLALRVPLGLPTVALNVDARYLAISSAGEFSSMDNYGGGTIAGVDVDAGLEVRPVPRVAVRGGVRYLRVAFDFDGTGADTKRDSLPTPADDDQDVGGALDEYLGGYVTASYLF